MKPNHKLTLLMVSVTTFNAVCFSACGDFIAAIYALGCAGLLIGLAKTEDRFYRTATGSIYGIEFAHKTIAKVAVRLPMKPAK